MRIIIGCLILVLVGLQYKLWVGDGSVLQWMRLEKKLAQQEQKNVQLALNNQKIVEDIEKLKHDPAAIEEKARYELGMIKEGEIYYQFVD